METSSKKIEKLKKEIYALEQELNRYKLSNKKVNAMKNMKIALKISQLLLPYLAAPCIVAGALKYSGFGLPFYQDDIRHNLKQMKELDNLGNIRVEQQYKNFVNGYNKIIYYGNWKQNEDGTYSRSIEHYRLRKITEEDILKLYQDEIVSMKKTFGNPIATKVETVSDINNNLIKEGYMQAIFYSENKQEFIILEETVNDNIGATILFLLMSFSVDIAIHSLKSEKVKYEYKNFIDGLENQYYYDIKDVTSVERKLSEIKRKYKVLTKDPRK